jgi:hypothetical protein
MTSNKNDKLHQHKNKSSNNIAISGMLQFCPACIIITQDVFLQNDINYINTCGALNRTFSMDDQFLLLQNLHDCVAMLKVQHDQRHKDSLTGKKSDTGG